MGKFDLPPLPQPDQEELQLLRELLELRHLLASQRIDVKECRHRMRVVADFDGARLAFLDRK